MSTVTMTDVNRQALELIKYLDYQDLSFKLWLNCIPHDSDSTLEDLQKLVITHNLI